MKRFTLFSLGALVAGLVLSSVSVTAQGRGQGGGFGGRGGFDPAQMEEFRARMAERMKTQLNATDEEWKIIQPLMEKVQEKQRATAGGRFGGMMGMMGRGMRPGGDDGGQRPQRRAQDTDRPGVAEMQALRDALEDENAPASEIKTKLKAVRDVRKKSEAELKVAREDLRKVLTSRQEAQCVLMGLLD